MGLKFRGWETNRPFDITVSKKYSSSSSVGRAQALEVVFRGCLDPPPNGKRANGKIFAIITSDVWMLIRSIKYSLIKN
jgi:hypothetical protein